MGSHGMGAHFDNQAWFLQLGRSVIHAAILHRSQDLRFDKRQTSEFSDCQKQNKLHLPVFSMLKSWRLLLQSANLAIPHFKTLKFTILLRMPPIGTLGFGWPPAPRPNAHILAEVLSAPFQQETKPRTHQQANNMSIVAMMC